MLLLYINLQHYFAPVLFDIFDFKFPFFPLKFPFFYFCIDRHFRVLTPSIHTLKTTHTTSRTPLSLSCLHRRPEIGAPAPRFSPANHSPIHPHPFLTLSRRSDDR
ncbi:hypothetical protein HanRHA438_Chr05g0232301 [Helianthus annuus]|uniref:Uncharacterized protein n=1 Tax=Helianthus annuus TaxID=4232 RepID=A0A251UUG0_HELAN|nr:hypothetical protein HanXRQr2_Chr05g0223221 [Helianthus annuus]KAJ0585186.1 hypothetical protein HanHA89_Chr05g0197401 [Helianthus annuus]KAJ0919672.1 hypothetical protein HanRHA438_Chr05g0232301 [Helianthus annuus]KAJ0923409.1 hypothetical protein HanPSC8_Chr05g0215551 [Helianthus annuus]